MYVPSYSKKQHDESLSQRPIPQAYLDRQARIAEIKRKEKALIASAPDLLSACEKALEILIVESRELGPYPDGNDGLYLSDLIDNMQNAIAKAKGGN